MEDKLEELNDQLLHKLGDLVVAYYSIKLQ